MFQFLHLLHKDRSTLERLGEILELKAAATKQKYLESLSGFLTWAKATDPPDLASVTPSVAMSYVAYLKKMPCRGHIGASPATIVLRVKALRSVWEILIEMKVCITNPWIKVAAAMPRNFEQRHPTQLIDPVKVRAVIDAAGTLRDRAVLCCLFGGALRRSEAQALTIGDISTAPDGTVLLFLGHTKGRHSDFQAIPDWAGAVVLELLAERKEQKATAGDPLFAVIFPHKPAHKMSVGLIYDMFKRAAKKAGVPLAAPHAARASAITKLLQDGHSPYDVAEFSRHSSLEMLKFYDKRRKEVFEGLGKKLRF